MTLSVTQAILPGMRGRLINNEVERSERKLSWLNLRYYTSYFLEILRNATKHLRIADSGPEFKP
jgi:hypothetical protein